MISQVSSVRAVGKGIDISLCVKGNLYNLNMLIQKVTQFC